MKTIIAKKDLVSAASSTANAAAKKSSLPALGMIKIEADGDWATFSGTDLFVGAIVRVPCATKNQGALLVPAKQFADACKALPDGDVTISLDDKRVEIKSGKTKHRGPWSPVSDYPDLPQCGEAFAVQASALAACLGSVAHAMYTGDDPGRANVSGAHLSLADARCRATSGTGQVIAHREMDCGSGGAFEVLIPHKAVAEVRRVLDAAKDGDVGVCVVGDSMFFVHENLTLSVKLIGETFPAVIGKLMGRANEMRPTFARDVAVTHIKNVMVGARDEFAHIDLAVSDGRVSIVAKDTESSSEFDIDYSGAPFVVRLPGGPTIAALNALTHDEVAMALVSPMHPVFFMPAEGAGQLQVIAPAAVS
jgi:DNA polymerase-3 subunit beta